MKRHVLALFLGAPLLAADERPNVVLILADDMGFSDLGCYGGEIDTPNLDALAADGLRFTQMYNTSKCFPSRACLLTGRYAQEVGMDRRPGGVDGATLGEVLRAAGYRTYWSGKHHGTENPVTRGFDRYYGLRDGACNHFNPGERRPGESAPAQKRPDRAWCLDQETLRPYTPPRGFYSTDAFTDAALGFLEETRGDERPFFLYLAYTAPHDPMMAWPEDVAEYVGRYDAGWGAVRAARWEKQEELGLFGEDVRLSPPDFPEWSSWPAERRAEEARRMEVYAAMVSQTRDKSRPETASEPRVGRPPGARSGGYDTRGLSPSMARYLRTKELLLLSLLTLVVVGTSTLLHLTHVSLLALDGIGQDADAAAREVLAVASERVEAGEDGEPAATEGTLEALVRAQIANLPSIVDVGVFGPDGNDLVDGDGAGDRQRGGYLELEELVEARLPKRLLLLWGEGRLASTTLPIQRGGEPFGHVRVDVDTMLARDEVSRVLKAGGVWALVALLLSLGVSILITTFSRRPLRRLAAGIDRLRGGEYEFELDGDLDADAQVLADKLGALGREMQSERLERLGRQATFERLMDQLRDGVLLLGPDERVVFCNRSFRQVAPAAPGEVEGRTIGDLFPGEGVHPILRLVEDALEDGRSMEDLPCRLPGRERFQESLVSVHLTEDRGRPSGVVVLVEDLGQFRTLQDVAGIGSRLVEMGELASGVAHDVRGPLNNMLLRLQLLQNELEAPGHRVRSSIHDLSDQVRFMDRILAGFVEFLRAEDPKRQPVDLATLARREGRLVERQARQQGVELSFDLSEARIAGDETLLRRAFGNACRNALEAMPDGGRLRLHVREDGERASVVVEDTGAGIPEEALEEVFRMYFTTKAGGSGIGLSVIKRIVQQHGGELRVESAVGRGTRLRIDLPLLAADPVRDPSEGSQKPE